MPLNKIKNRINRRPNHRLNNSLNIKNKEHNVSTNSYQEENKISPLKLLVIITERHQSEFYLKEFNNLNLACSFFVYSHGTATKEIYEKLGIGETKKQIILTFIKEDQVETVNEIIKKRFAYSRKTKGVSFTIPLSSISGVLMYRFLTNTQENIKKEKDHGKK